MKYRIGIDTGGTFTDVVLFDEKGLCITKTHSTPSNPGIAVINGINKIAHIHGIDPKEIDFLVHGTTVATNSLLEYKGVETAILLTEGFKDILSIARQTRPKLYDWFVKRPDPFIPRHLRYEVSERVIYTGEVIRPMNEVQISRIARELREKNITSIAVCLLHSYANPAHEIEIREVFTKEFPEAKICLSSDILREIREYERMSTTVINAYVMPIIERYLAYLQERMRDQEIKVELNIMQSNGGIMTAETAARKSVNTILSGPAGGVIGCMAIGEQARLENYITVDMGGTSFDISLIYKNKINYRTESEMAGHPISAPMIEIHTIGAGGGSIAWIDHGGALKVGPQSAGADPGPACYRKGGNDPTVTDANLVLGRLNPEYYLGGEVEVDVNAAKEIINDKIAKPLNLTLEEAAEGILKVVNANMIRGIKTVSVEKGYDAREFAIISFGGAGSLHAIDLARELDMSEVVIPLYPGANSAVGLLTADFRYDYSMTFFFKVNELSLDDLNAAYNQLEQQGIEQMEKEKISSGNIRLIRSVDMRYSGQAYELNLPVLGGTLTADSLKSINQQFHSQHKTLYGYAREKEATEFVYLRLSSVAILEKPKFLKAALPSKDPSGALKGHRQVYMEGQFVETPIYERDRLKPGNTFLGPAVIEQLDTTSMIYQGQNVFIDEYNNVRIKL